MWMVLMGIGGLVLFVGAIMFLVVAFKESVLWGLGCILIGPVELIFLIVHWNKASVPFFIEVGGLAVLFAGFSLAPAQVQNEIYAALKMDNRAKVEAPEAQAPKTPAAAAAVMAVLQPAKPPPPDTRSPEQRVQEDCASELGMLCNDAPERKDPRACLLRNKSTLTGACRKALFR